MSDPLTGGFEVEDQARGVGHSGERRQSCQAAITGEVAREAELKPVQLSPLHGLPFGFLDGSFCWLCSLVYWSKAKAKRSQSGWARFSTRMETRFSRPFDFLFLDISATSLPALLDGHAGI